MLREVATGQLERRLQVAELDLPCLVGDGLDGPLARANLVT
jgi:hypothetical protein